MSSYWSVVWIQNEETTSGLTHEVVTPLLFKLLSIRAYETKLQSRTVLWRHHFVFIKSGFLVSSVEMDAGHIGINTRI